MPTTATPSIDLDALGRALERRDIDALAAMYADDARFHVASPAHPPADDFQLRGRDAIADYVRDTSPDVTISLDDAVVGVDGRVVAHTICRHPDGRVICSAWLLETGADGRIVVQKGVEAWDE